MGLTDVIIIGVILLIVGSAGAYIIKAKKSGKKCIGCPDSDTCSTGKGSCGGACSCCTVSCKKKDQE